ncbi:probable G-protein coupled receptor 139 [Physella acuta]|uniref:probable G-protein coupled receptor 139 n=1 Tax=Physella acuta TaxID=109671 RepID=UPI0027DCEEB3|nr:probable G-protein coupled receptor 139 [Physella acuta]
MLSDDSRHVFEVVNLVFLSSLIALFGIVANIINIIIFYRQGYRSTVNISFTGLAVSDLCSLVVMQWYNLCFNPLFVNSGVPMIPAQVQHLTGGMPHLCFTRITGWITVYITAERCLCISSPLKIKRILTPKRSCLIIVTIYVTCFLTLVPEYMSTFIGWQFDPKTNTSLLSLIHASDSHGLDGVSFLLFGIYMILSFLIVGVCTSVLVYKLRSKSQWRQKSTGQINQAGEVSPRDQKTIRTVIVIASVMIVFFTPSVIITVFVFVVPEFKVTGGLSNLFLVAWTFGMLFEVVHSSVTLVLYYAMSSKYRHSFRQLFCLVKKPNIGETNTNTDIAL